MREISKILFLVIAAAYPVLVYFFVAARGVPLRHFSLFVIGFAVFVFAAGAFRRGKPRGRFFLKESLVLLALGVLSLVTNSAIILRFYPLLMNILLLATFAGTLFFPPNMIFRFATMQDKSIRFSLGEKQVEAYCRKVTIVWCAFFVLNGSVTAFTVFRGSDALWSVYNGGIAYILMGILFAGEFAVRKIAQKGIPKAAPLSAFKSNSRDASHVMCYEGSWSDSARKTWGDFLEGTAALRRHIEAAGGRKWLLHCDDNWHFLLAFTALLQCKKEILLSAHVSPSCLAEIRDGAPLLTDREDLTHENMLRIPALLGSGPHPGGKAKKAPAIVADETSIVMYTSGSAGKPKEIRQRLTEFENDNRFALSKWGEEFLKRKLCSTVNQHHIYGLLYSVLLPFTAGVPFRRSRIRYPEELEKLCDTEYTLITVPAFLKRAVEITQPGSLALKSHWIFSSGGVLEPETAQKTSEVFGFWPLEVYGSTETSGIAWRQSVNGLEWTAFDNAQLSVNDGCLVVRSPYINDPAGFETSDLAELLENGRFLLKGRMDSIVKIEEKRVSLAEVESRIMQSGLAASACVIAMEDKRQYLAAAVVFNGKGLERFSGLEKNDINRFWREYLSQYFESVVVPKKWRYPEALPVDTQGKIRKEDVRLLFGEPRVPVLAGKPQGGGFDSLKETVVEKTGNSVSLEFAIPGSTPYFDGHFPGFPILPGVAEIELVTRFAARYLETNVALSEIRRVKFTSPVRPDTPLLLKLEKTDKTIVFNLSSEDGKTAYSMGTVVQWGDPAPAGGTSLGF